MNYLSTHKRAVLTRAIVAVVLTVLGAVLTSGAVEATRLDDGSDAIMGGVLQAAGLLFFAFALRPGGP